MSQYNKIINIGEFTMNTILPIPLSVSRYTAIYIRVSTEFQAEEGYSIEAQTECLVNYCKSKKWDSYVIYCDGGFSGSNINRPDMQKLIQDIINNKVARVVVYKLDRLSRSQKDTLYLIEDIFLKNGVEFVSNHENIDTETPYGRAMIGILSAFAQLERENIRIRTQMGLLERIKEGYWRGTRAPLGYIYDKENKVLVIHPENALKVQRLFSLFCDGYNLQEISETLGIKHERTIYYMLRNVTYIGLQKYGKEVFPARHKGIISAEKFKLTQNILANRKQYFSKGNTNVHLFTKMIKCGVCGNNYQYFAHKNSTTVISCNNRIKDRSHPGDCPSKIIVAAHLESAILEDLFYKSDHANEIISSLLEEGNKPIKTHEEEIKELYVLYSQRKDTSILDTIDELKAADSLAASRNKTQHKIFFYQNLIPNLRNVWYTYPIEKQQELLKTYIDHIEIENSNIHIIYRYQDSKSSQIVN